MKEWPQDSKSRVAHMSDADFYASEKSTTLANDCVARIEFAGDNGIRTVLKEKIELKFENLWYILPTT